MADNKIVVNIAGMDYTLISDQDENQIEQIADYVDKKIREIDNDKLTRENQLVLASLNIADEMYKLLIKHKNLRKEAEEPIENYPKIKEAYEDLEEENQLILEDLFQAKNEALKSKSSSYEITLDMPKTIRQIKGQVSLFKNSTEEFIDDDYQEDYKEIKKPKQEVLDNQLDIFNLSKED